MFASLLRLWRPWFPVVCLTISAFIFNTTEFAPISLLTDIASDFNISEAHAGLMMTVYAWVVATTSLPLMLLTKDMERKKLLLLLFSFFIASHILSMLAWSFWVLMISRIGIALSHAIFWSITASLAYRLAPQGKKTRALGILATGTSLAIVLGLPLGRLIGQSLGWRTTFACIALIAFAMMFFLLKLLPQLPSVNAGSLKSLPQLIKRPALMGVYLLTALAITAHFTAYSYIEPFVQQIAHLSGDFATITLFIFGIAGMLGSIIFARFKHHYPFTIAVSSLGLLIASLLLMLPFAPYEMPFSALCLFWGIAICLVSLILQVTVLELTPDATDVAMSLYSGIYNIGIGGGAFVGSFVISKSSMANVGLFGALFGSVALMLAIWIWKKYLLVKN
ncbi:MULTISPECIES: sugar transporter [unclassified Sulfurospirillum]|uniref:sugar transporter n=1 Tax=unclassified Sulfurospirillum TaxID=2618290 RepID=UPI000507D031|nr:MULTISPECIES: sugar transporter [unclassified Sulfurospirillum]KFL34779.1 MFS transporter [Sulfurospirillum sp. SCADC]